MINISLRQISKSYRFWLYARYVLALFFASSSILLFLIFLSFSPNDQSLFFATTRSAPPETFFGYTGATIATLLFYFLGMSASLLVPIFMITAYHLIFGYYKDAVGTYCAAVGSLMVASTLAAFYGVDYWFVTSGGLLGQKMNHLLHVLLDPELVHGALLLFLVGVTFVVSSAVWIKAARVALIFMCFFCNKEKFLAPCGRLAMRFLRFWAKTFQSVWEVLTGVSIKEQSVISFEQLVTEEWAEQMEEDDVFWESFGQTDDELAKKAVAIQEAIVEIEHDADEESMAIKKVTQKIAPNVVTSRHEQEIDYALPNIAMMFAPSKQKYSAHLSKEYESLAHVLEEKLERFGIKGKVTAIKIGPVITLFEYEPDIDSKISKIIALEDDLALALQAVSIRIIAPIPGRSVVGFEVSNKERQDVLLSSILHDKVFTTCDYHLPLVLGHDVIGKPIIIDLAKAPHLLVAGSTGSGKSVALNTMLVTLLCTYSPDELKLLLIDPKRLEFASYADIGHLIFPIITDPRKAAPVLKWVVKEMEERYGRMESAGVRNLFEYKAAHKKNPALAPMPFIVVVIDELSDLMMTASKEIEDLIARITQMARAAGIHMIVATQRPSVDVITGLIKVNFPSRISFRVTAKTDSRTILDCGGADKLLGKGDMLYLDSSSQLIRAHGAYVSQVEIEKLITYIRSQQKPNYIDLQEIMAENALSKVDDEEDALYEEVCQFIQTVDEVSISFLQRKFRIGYNRSARIIEMLEAHGLIIAEPGSKTRKVVHD